MQWTTITHGRRMVPESLLCNLAFGWRTTGNWWGWQGALDFIGRLACRQWDTHLCWLHQWWWLFPVFFGLCVLKAQGSAFIFFLTGFPYPLLDGLFPLFLLSKGYRVCWLFGIRTGF